MCSITEPPATIHHCQEMTTLMLIILLAWFPLSLPLAVLAGKYIKLGSNEPDARSVPNGGRSQKIIRGQASARIV